MQFKVKKPFRLDNGQISLGEIDIKDIKVSEYCIMSIDGSTTNSGIAILREHDGALLYTISAKRENDGETPVHYKIRLKRAVKEILENNKMIYQVYYEEPVVANISAVKNLFMLRAFIEEMIIENEPTFDYLKYYEVSNMRWKKEFLAPDKVPQGTEKQKEAVRKKLESYLPFLNTVSQDEIDAICLGFVATQLLKKNIDAGEELQSKKKARTFKYETRFIGADGDDAALEELADIYDGPKVLLEDKAIGFSELGNRESFEKHILNAMGDDDKLLIIKFSSKYHGEVILKHRIGMLSEQFDFIYAIVWRTTRKY
jgi:hypothetical protein